MPCVCADDNTLEAHSPAAFEKLITNSYSPLIVRILPKDVLQS